jgi:hypothetical protein
LELSDGTRTRTASFSKAALAFLAWFHGLGAVTAAKRRP